MCFLFMFFVWSDPVFTTGIFILKYYDQQADHTLKSIITYSLITNCS